jgi:hypothetical protein
MVGTHDPCASPRAGCQLDREDDVLKVTATAVGPCAAAGPERDHEEVR